MNGFYNPTNVSIPKQGIRAVPDFGVNLYLRSCLYLECVEQTNTLAESMVWSRLTPWLRLWCGGAVTRFMLLGRVGTVRG